MINRGVSPSIQTPIRDNTFTCLKDRTVETSFASVSKSDVKKSAKEITIEHQSLEQ